MTIFENNQKQVFGDLVLKARNQREDLFLSLDKNLKDDMVSTYLNMS